MSEEIVSIRLSEWLELKAENQRLKDHWYRDLNQMLDLITRLADGLEDILPLVQYPVPQPKEELYVLLAEAREALK